MLERCTVVWVLCLVSLSIDLEGRIKRTAVNSTLSGNNITLNANNNIHVVGVDIQADNSISGNAKDINIPTRSSRQCLFVQYSQYRLAVGL
jgi:hypothetical protein